MSQEGLIRVDVVSAARCFTRWALVHVFLLVHVVCGRREGSLLVPRTRAFHMCDKVVFRTYEEGVAQSLHGTGSRYIPSNHLRTVGNTSDVTEGRSDTTEKIEAHPPQARENNGGSVTDPTPLRLSLKFF